MVFLFSLYKICYFWLFLHLANNFKISLCFYFKESNNWKNYLTKIMINNSSKLSTNQFWWYLMPCNMLFVGRDLEYVQVLTPNSEDMANSVSTGHRYSLLENLQLLSWQWSGCSHTTPYFVVTSETEKFHYREVMVTIKYAAGVEGDFKLTGNGQKCAHQKEISPSLKGTVIIILAVNLVMAKSYTMLWVPKSNCWNSSNRQPLLRRNQNKHEMHCWERQHLAFRKQSTVCPLTRYFPPWRICNYYPGTKPVVAKKPYHVMGHRKIVAT